MGTPSGATPNPENEAWLHHVLERIPACRVNSVEEMRPEPSNTGENDMSGQQRLVLHSLDRTRDFEVRENSLIGRGKDCDLPLNSRRVSRHHARIYRVDTTYMIEDLSSQNGTQVNGKRIYAPSALSSGDTISFHSISFEVELRWYEDPQATLMDGANIALASVLRFEKGAWAVRKKERPASPGEGPRPASPVPDSWKPVSGNGTVIIAYRPVEPGDADGVLPHGLPEYDLPCLHVESGELQGCPIKLRPLPGVSSWSIGRIDARDIRLPDGTISAYHADLTCAAGRWKVTDRLSVNGVYADGKKVTARYLSSGDVIRLGNVSCRLVLPRVSFAQNAGAAMWAILRSGNQLLWIALVVAVVVLAGFAGFVFQARTY